VTREAFVAQLRDRLIHGILAAATIEQLLDVLLGGGYRVTMEPQACPHLVDYAPGEAPTWVQLKIDVVERTQAGQWEWCCSRGVTNEETARDGLADVVETVLRGARAVG